MSATAFPDTVPTCSKYPTPDENNITVFTGTSTVGEAATDGAAATLGEAATDGAAADCADATGCVV
jgi:hypothetical protein